MNADDLGYSTRRDAGILSAFKLGALSSASLIVNGATSVSAARAARMAGLPVGLHLNLTEGKPLTTVKHITNTQGALLYKMQFWHLKKCQKVLADIYLETSAQLERFKELMGEYPTRVDGHQHAHVARHVPETIAPLLREKGVRYVRIPDQDPDDLTWLDARARRRYETRYVYAVAARLVYAQHGFKSPLCFVGLGMSGSQLTMARLSSCLAKCNGSTELMVHPGFLTPTNDSTDPFDGEPGRLHEYQQLMLVARAFTLVDWSSIQ